MEYVEGSTLSAVLQRGYMSLNEKACLFRCFSQVASALAFLRLKSIVHRDIKPANILVSNFGNPLSVVAKLCDFGLALPVHLPADSLARLSGVNKIHQRRMLSQSVEYDPFNAEQNPDALNRDQDRRALKAMLTAALKRNLMDSTVTLASLSSSSVLPADPVLPKIEQLLSEFDQVTEVEISARLLKFSREYLQLNNSGGASTPQSPASPMSLVRTTSPGLTVNSPAFYPSPRSAISSPSSSVPQSPFVSRFEALDPDDCPYFSEEK